MRTNIIQALFVFLFLNSSSSYAFLGCINSSKNESSVEIIGSEKPIRAEIALANMVVYSQEYMKYFFADFDSQVQPLPASGVSVFTGYYLSSEARLLTAFTLPLREEEVRRKNLETFRYYYPKLGMVGYEADFIKKPVLADSSCLRISGGVGLAFPLSYRLFQYIPPFVLSRAALRISSSVDMNFGIGYSGNVKSGAWFFPFGASYLLR